MAGDEIEVRGPIGGYFVWRGEAPLLLVAGGSGVAPVMAMLRSRRLSHPDVPVRLCSRSAPRGALSSPASSGPETTIVHTATAPPGVARPAGRITAADIEAVAFDSGPAYVCGSSGFVEAASYLLSQSGYPAGRIRLERYGPSSTQAA